MQIHCFGTFHSVFPATNHQVVGDWHIKEANTFLMTCEKH